MHFDKFWSIHFCGKPHLYSNRSFKHTNYFFKTERTFGVGKGISLVGPKMKKTSILGEQMSFSNCLNNLYVVTKLHINLIYPKFLQSFCLFRQFH